MTTSRFALIARDLRERICLGEFSDGALDSEAELCGRYAVSRPTVRRALEELRTEGLVSSRHGAGWFVVGTAFHQRLALGTFRHADSAIAEAGKKVERQVVEFGFRPAPTAMISTLALTGDSPTVLHARSVRTVDGEGLDVVREWVPAALAGALSRDDATHPGIWPTLARQNHPISTVQQTITAGLASDSDAQLLDVRAGDPLLLVRRTAVGADGIPLALSDHRYLATRFALEVEFNQGPASAVPPGIRSLDALSSKEVST